MRAALLLIAVLTVAWSSPARAQDLNDIPPPEALGAADAEVSLRIEWPTAGDSVKTPFTVTGVAAPGARLELWVSDELQRVFLADANGRFNTAVSSGTTGKIWIHQVDKSGKRLQSASVEVAWGGAAPTPEVQGETVTMKDAAAIDPFGKKAATESGLPKVSELDGSAPAPPPSADSWGDETAAAPAAGTTVAAEDLVYSRRPNTPSRGVRALGEAGLGLVGAATIGFGGVLVGFGLGLASNDIFIALGAGALGGAAGWVVGLPLGVLLAGKVMDGNGKWWAVALGEIAGFALAGVVVAGLANVVFDATLPLTALIVLPLTGAVIGYEVTSDRSAWEAKQKTPTGVQTIRPVLGTTGDGTFTFGATMRF